MVDATAGMWPVTRPKSNYRLPQLVADRNTPHIMASTPGDSDVEPRRLLTGSYTNLDRVGSQGARVQRRRLTTSEQTPARKGSECCGSQEDTRDS